MEHFFGNTLLKIESLFGCCTVSTFTLERHKWKVINASVCLLLAVLDVLLFCYQHVFGDKWVTYSLFVRSLKFYLLINAFYNALYGYQSKVGAAMDLDEIVQRLNRENFPILDKWMHRSLLIYSATTYLLHQILFSNTCYQNLMTKQISGFDFYNYYYHGVKICIVHGSVGALAVIFMIQRSINFKLDSMSKEAIPQARKQIILRNVMRIKEIQGGLFKVERDLDSYYWIYIMLLSTLSAVLSPYMFLISTIFVDKLNQIEMIYSCLTYFLFTIAVIAMSEKVRSEKNVSHQKLSSMALDSSDPKVRRHIKHQLLANLHRPSPFNCYFFDLDWNLVGVIVQTALMIILAFEYFNSGIAEKSVIF